MTIEPVNSVAASYQGSASATGSKASAETNADMAPQEVSEMPKEALTVTSNQANTAGQNNEQEAAKQNEQIKRAVENINKTNPHTEAIFGIHDGTNRVTIKIVDKDSKKVIKEFPPEKTLDMIEKVWEMAGLMVDEKR